MRLFLLVLLIVSMCACTDPKGATRVLEASGYKEVQITGWEPFFKSSRDDFYSTGFVAIAPNGSRVSGTVTGGLLFKGSTIRLD